MQIWTVANQKGGVGKTTTSVALAGLAAEAGERVLLLDLDPHGSLTSYFDIYCEDTSRSVFSLFEHRDLLLTLAKQGSEGGSDSKDEFFNVIHKITHTTAYENINVLPSVTALATLERQGIGGGMGLVLGQAFKMIGHLYDRVLIDCPPQLGVLMVNALASCDRLIIPVQTEFLAIKGLERILNTLAMLEKSNSKVINKTIVPTMFDRRTHASVSSLRAIRLDFGESVWPAKIPIDTRFRDASKAGVPPHLYDADCRGVAAYRSLYRYLKQEESKGIVPKVAVA